jgi:hypothetical protein
MSQYTIACPMLLELQRRSTSALSRIARAIGCQTREQYEKAVLQYVGTEPLAAQRVLTLIGLERLAPPSREGSDEIQEQPEDSP